MGSCTELEYPFPAFSLQGFPPHSQCTGAFSLLVLLTKKSGLLLELSHTSSAMMLVNDLTLRAKLKRNNG